MNYALTFDCLFIMLCFELAGVLTIKVFRKIMFDFKRIIHQTKPISDPRNVTWFEFSFQKYMIYSGPGGSGKYGQAEEIFSVIFCESV